MYNKALNCRYAHTGRQGRSKNRLRFPRHIIDRYEGTHLSMKKVHGWNYWHKPWVNHKHVIGLINKFVGKSYDKFIQVWHAKLSTVNEYIKQTYNLERVIDMEMSKHKVYSIKFYVDENGIIRKYKRSSSRYRYQLTKYQRKYNSSVKIPNLGICKRADREDYAWARNHSKQNPIMLGEFYVPFDNGTIKVPVYTCCATLMTDYYHSSNLVKFIEDRDLKLEEKKRRITETWIPITSSPYFGNPITTNLEGQYIFKEIPNSTRPLTKLLSAAICASNTEEINRLRDLIARTPKTKTIDIGYGKFYLFIKRADYEKQFKILYKT